MNYRIYKSDTKLDYDDYLDTEADFFLDAEVVDGHANIYQVLTSTGTEPVRILSASYPPGKWVKLTLTRYDQ